MGHLPEPLDALGVGEERLVTVHRVVDQPLVGLEDVARVVGVVERELQAQLVELHPGPGPLPVEGERELGGVGEIEGQVVRPLHPDAGPRREHRFGRLAEGDRDDPRALGHLLAGAQVEGNAGPAPVVDLAAQGHEGLGARLRRDALAPAIPLVLPAHHPGGVDRA